MILNLIAFKIWLAVKNSFIFMNRKHASNLFYVNSQGSSDHFSILTSEALLQPSLSCRIFSWSFSSFISIHYSPLDSSALYWKCQATLVHQYTKVHQGTPKYIKVTKIHQSAVMYTKDTKVHQNTPKYVHDFYL